MNCDAVEIQLDACFDAGIALSPAIASHVARCPRCAARSRALSALDQSLRHAPAAPPHAALVARITATIAARPPRISGWRYAAAASAATGFLVPGWFASDRLLATSWPGLRLHQRILPDWRVAWEEFSGIPDVMAGSVVAGAGLAEHLWEILRAHAGLVAGNEMAGMWVACVLCLAGAAALQRWDGLTAPGSRPRNENRLPD